MPKARAASAWTPADAEDLVGPGRCHGEELRRMHPLALARRRAGNHAGNSRGLGRYQGHDGRCDEGVGAARRVGAHGTHRDPLLPQHYAGHGFALEILDALPLEPGEVANLFLGEADVLLERVVGGGLGVIYLLSRYPERGRTPVVEALRVPAHRGLAFGFHRAENLADRGADLVRDRLRLRLGGFEAFYHGACLECFVALPLGSCPVNSCHKLRRIFCRRRRCSRARGARHMGRPPVAPTSHRALPATKNPPHVFMRMNRTGHRYRSEQATRTPGSSPPDRGRSCPRSPCTGRWPAA